MRSTTIRLSATYSSHYKSEVGKTITANLSAEPAYRGFNVLMTDPDRKQGYMTDFMASPLRVSPGEKSRESHLRELMNLCDSELEKEWLMFLNENNFHLPSHAQYLVEACHTRPDFFYENNTAIYIDGAYHDFPERHERDMAQEECMDDLGYWWSGFIMRRTGGRLWRGMLVFLGGRNLRQRTKFPPSKN